MKFEIWKLLGIIGVIAVVALIATFSLSGRYFKGSLMFDTTGKPYCTNKGEVATQNASHVWTCVIPKTETKTETKPSTAITTTTPSKSSVSGSTSGTSQTGGSSGSAGGTRTKVATKSGTSSTSTKTPTLTNPFKDLSDKNSNKTAILSLYKKGIISGYPDGSFKPTKTINRAELTKILVESTGVRPNLANYKNCFPDVTIEWFAPYVCYAKAQKWVEGYPDGKFMPANTVNNAEAIKLILRSQNVQDKPLTSNIPFSDVDKTAWYAQVAVTARDFGILEDTVSFRPSEGKTRGAVCENIFRLLND